MHNNKVATPQKETQVKFKNKQKTETQATFPPQSKRVITEAHLKDHQTNLRTQLTEAQTKVVMIQGAIQMVDLQIQELNPKETTPAEDNSTNGVK